MVLLLENKQQRSDVLTPAQRSYCMSRIRSKNTGPEKRVRSLVFGLGYRYRLHDKRLPGKPDLVFSGRKKVIFVHGCFWHMHACRQGQTTPRTHAQYWADKRQRTVQRDGQAVQKLLAAGWESLIVWECELKDLPALSAKICAFLA